MASLKFVRNCFNAGADMARMKRRLGVVCMGFTAGAVFMGCAGSGLSTPGGVAQAYADYCRDGDVEMARNHVAPALSQSPCPDGDVVEKMIEGSTKPAAAFYYRASLGQAELSRREGAAYKLRLDKLTERSRAEYTVERLKNCIRFDKVEELYGLLSSSLTSRITIDRLHASFDERPSVWNAIYAALAAEPTYEIQIRHKSAQCQASNQRIELVAEEGMWKIAGIEGVF